MQALRQGVITLDLDVGLLPEGREVGALLVRKPFEAGGDSALQRLVSSGRKFGSRRISAGDDGRRLLKRDGFTGFGRNAEVLGENAAFLRCRASRDDATAGYDCGHRVSILSVRPLLRVRDTKH